MSETTQSESNETLAYDPDATVVIMVGGTGSPTSKPMSYRAESLTNHLAAYNRINDAYTRLAESYTSKKESLKEKLIELVDNGMDTDEAQEIADIFGITLERNWTVTVSVDFTFKVTAPLNVTESDVRGNVDFDATTTSWGGSVDFSIDDVEASDSKWQFEACDDDY